MLGTRQKNIGVGQTVSDIFRPPTRAFSSLTYAQEVLLDSPVVYLRFEEVSGTTCADSSGNGLNGSTNGTVTRNVTSHAGLGVAVTLAGATTSYISVADNASLDITGAFSFECWVKPTNFTGDPFLFSKGQDSGTVGGYGLWVSASASKLRLIRGNIGSIGVGSTGTLSTGVWSHVVVTRDGSGVVVYYINGIASGTYTDTTAVQATNQPLTFGVCDNNGTFQEPLLGSLDECALYNTALSQARVTAHFNAAA